MSKPHPQSDQTAIDALYRISRLLNETDQPNTALQAVVDEIIKVLPAESAAVGLLDPDQNRLLIEAFHGFPRDLPETRLKLGEGVTGWVALHGKPLNIGNVDQDPRYITIDPQIRSEMAVPLLSDKGQVLGVVNVDSCRPNAFSPQDQKVLTLLTAEASRVLNRLWLIQQLRRAAQQREALIRTAEAIVNERQADTIIDLISRRALAIQPCHLCAVFLLQKDQQHLTLHSLKAHTELPDYAESIHLDQSSLGTAIKHAKPIEVHDLPLTEEHHFIHLRRQIGLASLFCCPIQLEDATIGLLNVYTHQPHRFNDDEKRVFQTLANLAAAGIRNARLYDRVFQTEENLRRSERLTTLGLLSAEIAHEIRNPLTVIQLLFESLTLDFNDNDPRQRDVAVIHEKLEQLDALVTRVLGFGKARKELHACYDLNHLLEETLHLVRLKLKQARVDLNQTLHHEPIYVNVSKAQLQQALLNVVLNAVEAMPNGGSIHIVTTEETIENGSMAVLRLHDTGHGIDPAIREHVFDSFLTNRPGGTGLGLSITKRILADHKGTITVEDSGPGGTRIRIALPRVSPPR